MLPVVTEKTIEYILRRRKEAIKVSKIASLITQELREMAYENPELVHDIVHLGEVIAIGLQKEGFAKETAEELTLLEIDLSVALYSFLKLQAEKDKLTLPKVYKTLAEAFTERLAIFLVRHPDEVAEILKGNPQLLRGLMILASIYASLVEEEARKAVKKAREEGFPAEIWHR